MSDADLTLLKSQLAKAQKENDNLKSHLSLVPGYSEPSMEARVAKLESDVGHIRSDIFEIKTDIRNLHNNMKTDFYLLFAALIFVAVGLSGLVAKGFRWLG
jgi:hypothetical protein